MRLGKLLLPLFALMAFTGSLFAADEYTIDNVHSYVGFSVKHLVISTARGNFTTFSGTINYDESEFTKSSVEVSIDVASIDTDNEDRDNHLRSADFFDVEKFPQMTFKSTKVEKTSDGLVMHGQLTMHGVTNEVVIPFEMAGKVDNPWGQGNTVVAFDGETKISRKDFGMTWNKVIEAGGLAVGDEVKIEIHIEAVKKK